MIRTTVQEIIAGILDIEEPETIKTEMTLAYDLNMDDSEIEAVLNEAEAEWDLDLISFAPELETVGDVISYIKSQL